MCCIASDLVFVTVQEIDKTRIMLPLQNRRQACRYRIHVRNTGVDPRTSNRVGTCW